MTLGEVLRAADSGFVVRSLGVRRVLSGFPEPENGGPREQRSLILKPIGKEYSMRIVKATLCVTSMLLLCVGSAFADKQSEMDEYLQKPWSITDLPQINQTLADVFETEPLNDTCPGEPYTLGDTYHGSLTTGDDDWVNFSCNAHDVMTLGTQTDNTGDDVDTVIELWDDTCTNMLISDDDGGPGLYSLIDGFKAPYTGSYSLKIRGFAGVSTGDYQFIGSCTPQAGPVDCPVGLYKASKINVNAEIPDNDPAGLCTPEIKFNPMPGFAIADVVIDINMNHTWVGDLVITVTHTSSTGVVKSADLVNRPGVPESSFGCSGDLISDPEAKYFFGSDPALEPLGEFDCPSIIDPACYAVAIENPGALEIFRQQECGDGTWQLCVTDNASGDVGTVFNWSVHLLCDKPISVEEKTWGEVKGLYRTD
jgi:subtilisin-like proprotein convertase family protein